jgi:hypothetical protein
MTTENSDHDGLSSESAKAKETYVIKVRSNMELANVLGEPYILLGEIDSRQEYSGDPLAFWTVQTTNARGNAFLSYLKATQAQVIHEFEKSLRVIKAARKRALEVMDAARARNAENKERRKDSTANKPSQPVRARVICASRGCYGEAYRDGFCYDHFMAKQKKSPRGVSEK